MGKINETKHEVRLCISRQKYNSCVHIHRNLCDKRHRYIQLRHYNHFKHWFTASTERFANLIAQTRMKTFRCLWLCNLQINRPLIHENCSVGNPLTGTLKPQSNGPYGNTVIGTLAVDGWDATFGTARRRLGGLHPGASSLYQT